MNVQKQATPDHPIHQLIAERWSPYAFADRPVSSHDLRSLFEAARWAASSYNEQPWRYILATKANTTDFERLLSCLVEGNQLWARNVPVLAIGCTHLRFARNDKPNAAAVHDLGLASATLTLEATARGLFVHQMIGIVPDKVRATYRVPDDVHPLTGLAVGYAADPNTLPETLRARDLAPRERNKLADFVFGSTWGASSTVLKVSEIGPCAKVVTISRKNGPIHPENLYETSGLAISRSAVRRVFARPTARARALPNVWK